MTFLLVVQMGHSVETCKGARPEALPSTVAHREWLQRRFVLVRALPAVSGGGNQNGRGWR
jgi:hypothetical protein